MAAVLFQLVEWVELFAKPIAFIDENRWVSLRSRIDFACVQMPVGGVHRSLPPGKRIVVSGMTIHNRLDLNTPDEVRESPTAYYCARISFQGNRPIGSPACARVLDRRGALLLEDDG